MYRLFLRVECGFVFALLVPWGVAMLELASVWLRFGLDFVTCPHAIEVASFIVF